MAGYGEGGSPGSTKATTTAASSTMSTPLAPPPVAPPSRLRAGDEESNSNAASPSQSKEPSKPSAASSAAVPLPRSQRMAEEKESSASAGTTSSARPNTSPAESTSADSATRKDRAGCAMSKEGASAEVKRLTRESSAMEETSSVSSPSAGAGAGGGGGTGLQSPSSALRPQSSSSQYTAATSSFTTASDSTAAAMKLSTRKPKSVAGSQDSNGLVAHSITVQDLYSLFKTREEAQRVAATAQSEAPRTSSSSISASPPAGVDDAPTSLPLTERVLAAPLVTSAEVTPAGDVTKAASTLSTPYPASTVMTVTTPTPAGEAAPAAPTAAATPSAHFLAALPREPSHPSLRDDDEDMTFYLPDHIASSDDEDGYSRGSTPHRESGAAIAAQYLLSSSQPQSHSSLPSTMEPYESIFGDNSTQSLLQLLQGATMASSHPIAAAGTRGGEGHHQPVPIHLEHDEQMTKEALENIANAFTTIALPREQVASVHGSQEDSRAAMQQPALVSSVPGLTSACTPYTTAIMAAPDASGGTTPHPTPVPVAAAVSPQPESSFTFSVTSNPQPPHVPVSPAHVVKGTVSSERSGRRRPPSKETKSPPITASTNMPTVSVGVSSLSTAALRTTAKPQEQGTWSVRGSEHITSPSHGGDSARRGGPGGNGGNAAAGAGQGQGAGGGGGGRRGRDHGSSATASSAHSLGLALRGMEIPQVPAPSQQQQQQQSQEDNLPVPVPTATAASASLSTSFGGTTVAPLTSLVRGGVPGAATGSSVSSTHLNPAGTSPGPTQLSASLGSSQLRPPSPSQAVSSHQISQQPQQQQQTQFVQIQQPIAAFTTAGAVAQASTNANNGGGGVTQGSVLLSAPGQGQTMMLVTLPDGRLAVCPVVYTAPTQQAVYVSPGYTATSTPNGLQLVSQGSGGSGGGYPVQVVYRSANGGSGNGGGSEQVQTHYLMLSQPNSQQ